MEREERIKELARRITNALFEILEGAKFAFAYSVTSNNTERRTEI